MKFLYLYYSIETPKNIKYNTIYRVLFFSVALYVFVNIQSMLLPPVSLTVIAQSNVDDVRPILDFYRSEEDVVAAFRRNQEVLLKQQEELLQAQKQQKPAGGGFFSKGFFGRVSFLRLVYCTGNRPFTQNATDYFLRRIHILHITFYLCRLEVWLIAPYYVFFRNSSIDNFQSFSKWNIHLFYRWKSGLSLV